MQKLFSFFIIFSTMIGFQAHARCLVDASNPTIDDPAVLSDCLDQTLHLMGDRDHSVDVMAVSDLTDKLNHGFLINRATLMDYDHESICGAVWPNLSGSMKYEAFKRLAQVKSTVANQQCLDVERFDLEFTLIQPDTHEVVTLKIPDNVTSAPKN